MTLKEILALPQDSPLKADNLLDKASLHKYISIYSSFFDWAVNRKDAHENNFKTINVSLDKAQKRDAFTSAQMRLIVERAKQEEKLHYKWGALLGCYTGARLEELAQMSVADVKKEGEIYYFDINDEEDKKLKNRSSKRTVPVHSKLIEEGFLEYLETCKRENQERVLFGLTYSGRNGFGRNLSRWFNERLLSDIGAKKKGLSFHSLRHTVITELQQAGIQDSLIKRLVGHAQADVTNAVYAKGQTMAQKKAAIEKLA